MAAYFRLANSEFGRQQEQIWERIGVQMDLLAGPIVECSAKFEGTFVRDKRLLAKELFRGPFRYRIFRGGMLSGETRECANPYVLKYLEECLDNDPHCAVVVGANRSANGNA